MCAVWSEFGYAWHVALVLLALCLSLGLSWFQFFFSPRFFCWSQIRWYKFIVGCCERSGLHFGMRDMLQWGGLCCAWACRGSNIFLPASLLLDLMSRWYLFVAGCCKRFDLYLGMRDVLHLWGLCCGCPLFCCGSIFFSPRAPFWGSHFSLISTCGNLLWTDRSAFGYASRFAFVRLVVCLLGLAAAPVFFSSCPYFRTSFLADISLLQVVVSGLVCTWVCGTCCICLACVVFILGLVVVPTLFLVASFCGISCLADNDLLQVVVSGLVCVWVCVTCCICVAFIVLAHGLVLAPVFLLGPFLEISCLADTRML